jgi:hypothetical protein
MGGLRVAHGLRMNDGANAVSDIPPANYSAGTVNAASVEMTDFNELLAVITAGVVASGGTAQLIVQESDESAANFTNISGATATINNASNTSALVSVDWKHPDRKKYARAQVITATAASFHGVATMRVQPIGGPVDEDDNVTLA